MVVFGVDSTISVGNFNQCIVYPQVIMPLAKKGPVLFVDDTKKELDTAETMLTKDKGFALSTHLVEGGRGMTVDDLRRIMFFVGSGEHLILVEDACVRVEAGEGAIEATSDEKPSQEARWPGHHCAGCCGGGGP